MVAGHGLSAPGLSTVQQVFPRPAADDTTAGRAIQSRRPIFVTDIRTDKSVPPLSRQMIEALGTRSQVTVPMLRGGEPIGAITVGWADPGAYGDQQVALLQTFADQAVIAIENVAAVQRNQGGAGAADRDGRHPQGHRQFALGRAAGIRRPSQPAPTG